MQKEEVFMRLFTPFTITKKIENCDLCRIEKNKKKAIENHYQASFLETIQRNFLSSFSTELQLLGFGLLFEDQLGKQIS